MHAKSYDLSQEGAGEASPDQLFVSPAQRGLVQTLPHQAARELIDFEP